MKLPIFIADAFTAKAFRGNPAAVCLLEDVSTDLEILDSCRTPYFFFKKTDLCSLVKFLFPGYSKYINNI